MALTKEQINAMSTQELLANMASDLPQVWFDGGPGEATQYFNAGLQDPWLAKEWAYKENQIPGEVPTWLDTVFTQRGYLDPVNALGMANQRFSSVAPDSESRLKAYYGSLGYGDTGAWANVPSMLGLSPNANMTAWMGDNTAAAQAARDDDGGLFGGMDIGTLAMLAAAIYSGGAAGGLWGGLGEGAALAGAGEAATLGSLGSGTMGVNLAGLGSYGTTAGMAGALGSGLSGTTLASLGLDYGALAGLGAAGAAGSTAGGGMGDLTDLWSQAFGEGGGWNPLTDGYGMGDAVSSAAGYGQNMATAAELAQMQAQYPDWYNALTGVTDVGISPSNIWNAFKAATGTGSGGSGLLSGGLTALGGYLQGTAGQDAATKAAAAQIQAAQIAADAAKFRPVGVTTRFGKSDFIKDANGNVIGAGYALTPDVKAQQDQLMAASGGMLNQFTGSQAATAPMGQAAQTMMTLGNSYLATTPEQQAQKYMAEQQALLATGRERDTNQMLTGEFNRGTYGLSTGGTSTGMMGANPRLEALYNAQRQQDLGLAAQATQGGMDYAKFGAGMVGSGGDMLKNMYGTQTASYDPYKTAMGGAQTLEGLGQNAMDLGVNLGKVTSNAQSGQLLGQGMLGASQTMQQADAYSPWGAMLTGAGNTMQNYGQQQQQQQYQFNPFTGVRL